MQEHNIVFIGTKKKLPDGKLSFSIKGTGIILKDLKVITVAHIYNEAPLDARESFFIGVSEINKSPLKTYISFDVIFNKKDDDRDIAIFEIKDPERKLTSYGEEKTIFATEEEINTLKEKKRIYIQGFPFANEFLNMSMGVTLLTLECIVGSKKYNNFSEKIDFILIDRSVSPGGSGSPVFLTDSDKIIGLAAGSFNQSHKIGDNLVHIPVGVGLVRTSNYILDLLEE